MFKNAFSDTFAAMDGGVWYLVGEYNVWSDLPSKFDCSALLSSISCKLKLSFV